MELGGLESRVEDPYSFDTDPDLDPDPEVLMIKN
jgi:hypothetical protein